MAPYVVYESQIILRLEGTEARFHIEYGGPAIGDPEGESYDIGVMFVGGEFAY